MAKSIIPTEHTFQLLKTKITHKQAATKGGCNKGMAKHLQGGKSAFGDGLQTSDSHWWQRHWFFPQIIFPCPIASVPVKMGPLEMELKMIIEHEHEKPHCSQHVICIFSNTTKEIRRAKIRVGHIRAYKDEEERERSSIAG